MVFTVQDFIIVDEVAVRPLAFRAMTIHAATLEVRFSGVSYARVEPRLGPRFD